MPKYNKTTPSSKLKILSPKCAILGELDKRVFRLTRLWKTEDREDAIQAARLLYIENPPPTTNPGILNSIARRAIYRLIYKMNTKELINQETPTEELPETEAAASTEEEINFKQIKNIIEQIKELTPIQKRVILYWLVDDSSVGLTRSEIQSGYQARTRIQKYIKRGML